MYQISVNVQSDVVFSQYVLRTHVRVRPRPHIAIWIIDGHSASHLTRGRRRDASKLHDIIEILQIHHTTHLSMALLVDKHRPRNLEALNYHSELSERLRSLVSNMRCAQLQH